MQFLTLYAASYQKDNNMDELQHNYEPIEVDLARIISVGKESYLNFRLKVDKRKRWRIVVSSRFPHDRRLAGQYGMLYEKDIPFLKTLIAEAENAVRNTGRFGKPLNLVTNVNANAAKMAMAAVMTCGLSLLYAINKKPKVHPRTATKIGSVGPLTILVISEEPRKAFVQVHVVEHGSRNAPAWVRLDEKGFQRLRNAISLIEATTQKLGQ